MGRSWLFGIVSESRRGLWLRCSHLVGNGVGVAKRDELNRDPGRLMAEGVYATNNRLCTLCYIQLSDV